MNGGTQLDARAADPVPGKIIEVLLTFNRTSGTGFYASADAADLAACSIFAQ